MEGLDEVPELVDRALRAGPAAVRGVGREEGDRLVAPVVRPVAGRVQGVEREDRQQLDRGDAEADEVRDPLDEPGERAAPGRVDAGVGVGREAFDVSLVDDRVSEGPAQRRVALPVVVAEVDDDALHGSGEVTRRGAAGRARVAGRDHDPAAVRVEQDPIRGEPQAAFRRERTMGSKAVHLTRLDPRHEGVPVRPGPVRRAVQLDHPRRVVVDAIEQQDVDRARPLRVDRHVDAVRGRHRADRMARPPRRRRERLRHRDRGLDGHVLAPVKMPTLPQRPTLACIIPPSTT